MYSLAIGVPSGPHDSITWLGREDSNLRMAESKSAALPLGYAPSLQCIKLGEFGVVKPAAARERARNILAERRPWRIGSIPIGLVRGAERSKF